ncbi:MAG: protein-arginine deiminase, partial [Okeania sp. SIO2H7]|nr:protein-arginine deiminase [Okeania sp. SIO2H7]
VLGVEAKQFADRDWSGVVSLKAIAKEGDREIAFDGIVMGVVPWVLSPNTAPATEVRVSDRGFDNQEFVAQVKQIVEKTGVTAKVISGGPAWMQDTKKIGYVQFPTQGKVANYNVALKANTPGNDTYTQSVLEPDVGWFEVGETRQLDPLNRWSDAMGNLAVTPPLPGYPMGRIYYGSSGDVSFDPEVIEFIEAQQLQGPPVEIDTSWLLTRQVDEIITFLPSKTGEPLVAIASPEAGIQMLEKLAEMGYGQAAINRGLSTQTTVRATLANKTLIQHNLNLQRNKLNPLLNKLKREFQLTDDQIIMVPILFGYSGYAWCPNLVNSVVINDELLVSNPRGPIINGGDYFQEQFRQLIGISGLKVHFLEDGYYQELRGNTRDATNTTRQGDEKPFWESLK